MPPLVADAPTGPCFSPSPPKLAPTFESTRHEAPSLRGVLATLVTPFLNDGIADSAFAEFVDWQVNEGGYGIVIGGAIGEAATLSPRECIRLVEIAVETAGGRVPVVAATGGNCTRTTIELTRAAQTAGATAALVVAPYYNRPGQEGLFRHFRETANAVSFPVLIENDPSRTAINILPETLSRLGNISNIVGVVEGSDGGLTGDSETNLPADWIRLFADESRAASLLLAGRHGAISTLANITPRLVAQLHLAADVGDWARAADLQRRLQPLARALLLESGPGPVKFALSLVHSGFSQEMRLPMVAVSGETAKAVAAALEETGLRR